MSKKSVHAIACPFCGKDQEVELWDAVSVDDDPQLHEGLLMNRLNTVSCEACGETFRVEKPLFYRDNEAEIFIYFDPVREGHSLEQVEQHFEIAEKQLKALLPPDMPAPKLHLVVEWRELVERVLVLEEGLDPRVLEHIKYMTYRANPDRLPAREKVLLFNAQDTTEENLRFVIQDIQTRKLESQLDFARENYDALADVYSGEDAGLLDAWFPSPYVNGRLRYLADEENDELDDWDDTEMELP